MGNTVISALSKSEDQVCYTTHTFGIALSALRQPAKHSLCL